MAAGSSPLTRGKRGHESPRRRRPGLIPAHAGKTRSPGFVCVCNRAHPRSRGDNPPRRIHQIDASGSSPLTRGKQMGTRTAYRTGGLIPAHAGKTSTRRPCMRMIEAHPRSRGENHETASQIGDTEGSSPLTRGKHFLTCAFIAQIDQILESLELCAFSESYSSQDVYATDAPRDRVRSIGLAPRSSRGAS